jgi:hypothetical protein
MKSAWGNIALLALAQLPLGSTAPNCPLIGPEFPPPQHLSDHPIWKSALANITAIFQYIDDSNITGIDKFSYSLQVFSTNPGQPILWERHRTAKDVPTNTTGVKQVDEDTVYRLGSVTKVFTVLAFLAEVGDVHWNQPIIQYIPELAKYSSKSSSFDSVKDTAWDDITIGSLASQVSGLGRDCRSRYLIAGVLSHILGRWCTWRIHRVRGRARLMARWTSASSQLDITTLRSLAAMLART